MPWIWPPSSSPGPRGSPCRLRSRLSIPIPVPAPVLLPKAPPPKYGIRSEERGGTEAKLQRSPRCGRGGCCCCSSSSSWCRCSVPAQNNDERGTPMEEKVSAQTAPRAGDSSAAAAVALLELRRCFSPPPPPTALPPPTVTKGRPLLAVGLPLLASSRPDEGDGGGMFR